MADPIVTKLLVEAAIGAVVDKEKRKRLLALILGPMSESNIRRYMQIVDGNFMQIFTRPICIIFFALAVFSIIAAVLNQRKIAKRIASSQADDTNDASV